MSKGKSNKRYTPELKQLVIKTMRAKRCESLKSMAIASLSTGGKSILKTVEEDLIAENQRLRVKKKY